MRRISKFVVLFLAAGAVAACNNLDEAIPSPVPPTAGVRFINAVPDTNRLDMRFVDFVENNAQFNVTFRNNPVTSGGITASTLVQYKPARAGSRRFRIFLSSSDNTVASVVLKDTVVTLTAGSNYTALLWGNARGGAPAMQLSFFEETEPDPGANIALRVINATGSAIDAEQYTCSGTGCATGAPTGTDTWSNVGPLTASAYATRLPGTVRIRFTAAGGANPLVSDGLALQGLKATFSGDTTCNGTSTPDLRPPCDTQAAAGTLVAGSVLSAILFPGSVPGSPATQFNVTTGSQRARATAAGYEGPRSYVSDGFTVGMQVNASGFTNAANNGLSTVTSVANGASRSTSSTVRFAATAANTYTRTSGSFVTDGFLIGDVVTVTGFLTSTNNGEANVLGVTATTLTVDSATVLEAGTTGSTTLAANGNGYSRTAGSFIADGFQVGHAVTVAGFATAANNGSATITFVDPDGLNISVSKTPAPVVEAAAAGRSILVSTSRTIAAFGKLNVTKAGGTVAEAQAGSRTIAASPNAPGVSYVWDRRPPRGCIAPYC